MGYIDNSLFGKIFRQGRFTFHIRFQSRIGQGPAIVKDGQWSLLTTVGNAIEKQGFTRRAIDGNRPLDRFESSFIGLIGIQSNPKQLASAFKARGSHKLW